MTVATLLFGQSLLLFTLRADAVHFTVFQIILKVKTAAWAVGHARFYRRFAARHRALEDGFTGVTPVFPFKGFIAFRALLGSHGTLPVVMVAGR